jgi:hypothetical protein
MDFVDILMNLILRFIILYDAELNSSDFINIDSLYWINWYVT